MRSKVLLWLNVVTLIASLVLWPVAWLGGWLESVTFVSHISMAALVISALSGIAAGDAAVEASTET